MNILKPLSGLIRSWFYNAERNRVDDQFKHVDDRLDPMERDIAVIKEQLKSFHEISTANNEAVEQKVNATKSSIDALTLISNHQFAYMNESLGQLKDAVKSLSK